jgi:hypothetical protein
MLKMTSKLRSRVEKILNVFTRYACGFFLPAASLDSHFEHPATIETT